MFRRQWLAVIVLTLLPINAWLLVFYYLHLQRKPPTPELMMKRYREEVAFRLTVIGEKWGIKEGRRLVYPFPVKSQTILLGTQPSVGKGYPVLFINISWITAPEVFEPAIQEALKASPFLHVVLLSYPVGHYPESHLQKLREMLKHFHYHPRLSILVGEWVHRAFRGEFGILAILCDGTGIVQAVELYPPLKIAGNWEEEVADWRPKLHQAVKKVLDKFFPKGQRR